MTKLFICVFIEKNSDAEVQKKYDSLNGKYMTVLSKFAIGVSALIIPIFGFTSVIMDKVNKMNLGVMDKIADIGETFMTEGGHAFSWEDKFLDIYSMDCIVGAAKSLIIGLAVYLIIIRPLLMRKKDGVREYVNVWPAWLDLEDSFYRPLLNLIINILAFVFRICDKLIDGIVSILRSTLFVAINTIKTGDAFAVLNVESKSSKAVKTVTDSLSMSLLLFCLGLCIALF